MRELVHCVHIPRTLLWTWKVQWSHHAPFILHVGYNIYCSSYWRLYYTSSTVICWHTEKNQLVVHWWQYTKSTWLNRLNIRVTLDCREVGASSSVTTAVSQTLGSDGCWCTLGDWHTTTRVCLLLKEHGTSWSRLLIHRPATATNCQCSQLQGCQMLLFSSFVRTMLAY